MTALSDPYDVWIVNAAPLIGLAKVECLGLLQNEAGTRLVLLPEAVTSEVQAGPANDAAVHVLTQLAAHGLTRLPPVAIDPRVAAFGLDAGESAVLTEVLSRSGSLAVIDDGPGRAAARTLRLPLTGTLGVLIRARRLGRLRALAPVFRDLKSVGIFLPNDADLRNLLVEFGEVWP